MRQLADPISNQLKDIFDGRVSFHEMERRLYGHDVGVLPGLIRPLIGDTTPAAVVQPHSEAELVEVVRLAAQHGIPLIPRGKATSGYGGVLPVEGGIVVDFYRMQRILDVDRAGQTVTVQPGVVWERLEKELTHHDLALRLYPSSAPSSTVGGWLAQGGVGFGSSEYGPFRENVVSAGVVLPDGEVREFGGEDLDLISDAEGITGLISQVTLRVRELEDEVVLAARFDQAAALSGALQDIAKEKVPLWSISFANPAMARLKRQMPPKLRHGHPVEEHQPELPETYVAVFVYPATRQEAVEADLKRIVAAHGGELLADELAAHEWEERFNLMKIKRIGPSLIPTEVVVPLENLDRFLSEIESAIAHPLVLEGLVSKGGEVTVLGFIPHDERSFSYNLAFGLALSVIKIAKRHGGRAYSTGLYFAKEAENVLGRERLNRLLAFKKQVDPQGIMNPAKVVGNGLSGSLLGSFMGLAESFEPLVRLVGNAFKSPLGERLEEGEHGLPAEVAWYAYACAQCGYCVDECDQFYGRGWESQSPRGKWYFLRQLMEGKADWDQKMVDSFIACTTCEVCNVRCPLELPIEPAWLEMRGQLIHKEGRLTFPPFEIMRASLRKERNIWASYSQDRANWVPENIRPRIKEKAEIAYFPGCTASFVEQDIAQATVILLDAAGVEFTYLGDGEACCGIPMLAAGLWDAFEEIMRHNVAGMKERGVKTVVTSCPACWLVWKEFYPQWAEKLGIDYPFDARHYSEIIAERIESGEMKFDQPVNMRVTWHDSCHMGRAGGIYEPPRKLIQAIPGVEFVEMEHNRDNAHCCGSVITLVADPPVAKIIGNVRLREAAETGAEAVLAACPCCQVQLRVTANKTGQELPILDLAAFAARSLGLECPDPTDYALEMWATFEAMINLMKPENMADLMTELLPQMMAAMPAPLGGMMKMAKHIPGMLSMMKPMMPIMMPVLMPLLMPKVMPDMLAAVERRVPMPDHMKEQMPELMPAAMENLMPKMLPQIVPLVTPAMIEYLRNN